MSSVRHVSSIQPRSAAPTGASLQTWFMLVLIDSEHSTVRDTVCDSERCALCKKESLLASLDMIAVAFPLALAKCSFYICSQRKKTNFFSTMTRR